MENNKKVTQNHNDRLMSEQILNNNEGKPLHEKAMPLKPFPIKPTEQPKPNNSSQKTNSRTNTNDNSTSDNK